jgi:GGDEF domain-containing protein
MPLAVTVGVSIGISLQDGCNTDFDRMYRDAGEALYQARVEGKSRVGVLTQTATTPFQPERSPAIA